MDLKHQHLWVAPTLGVFLRKIAIDYVRFGYTNYILRKIPDYKDAELIDHKLIDHYSVTWNRTARLRARRKGAANVTYIRWRHQWVLLATPGQHNEFYKRNHRNVLKAPLNVSGYSIGINRTTGKVFVRLAPRRYSAIEKALKNIALHNHGKVTGFINSIAFVNFPEVIREKQQLTRLVNKRRKVAGLKKIADPMSLIKRQVEERKALKKGSKEIYLQEDPLVILSTDKQSSGG